MITSSQLREKFLQFFESKGHARIASAPVPTENDPTTLFIGAGMQPMVPFLAGEVHPEGTRICDSQKCIRTGDIDEVGDISHLTFFEMLGNWSLGDYFKEESIAWSWEFLTDKKWLGLDIQRLAFTCYQGSEEFHIPADTDAAAYWIEKGVSEDRVVFLGDDDNWWPKIGMDGLCGPDTEIFYWVPNDIPAPEKYDPTDNRWVEIWNNVFMQYESKDGKLSELKNKNIDTGMGMERALIALNGLNSVYESDLFLPALEEIERLVGKHQASSTKSQESTKSQAPINEAQTTDFIHSQRIIADHVRASTIIISDGVVPSNVDQGYVLRKLLRRAIRHGKKLGIEETFLELIASRFIESLKGGYPELEEKKGFIFQTLIDEEKKFQETLKEGLKEFEKILQGFQIAFEKTGEKITNIPGAKAFKLYDTYGLPIEITKDLAKENGLTVDETGFNEAFEKHQELSRAGSEKKFAGGLADHSPEVVRLHTATHLMLQALKGVTGKNIEQRGSNITAERLRFDFTCDQKVTPEQLEEVEAIVNDQIQKELPVHYEEMSVPDAMELNATGIFVDKYKNDLGGKVKVYFMGDFSTEICGGPHVQNTKELGRFKIVKEEAVSNGVRRIKAVLEKI